MHDSRSERKIAKNDETHFEKKTCSEISLFSFSFCISFTAPNRLYPKRKRFTDTKVSRSPTLREKSRFKRMNLHAFGACNFYMFLKSEFHVLYRRIHSSKARNLFTKQKEGIHALVAWASRFSLERIRNIIVDCVPRAA